MSKDKIEVSMSVYDIPIVVEALEKAEDEIKKLQQENQQLENNRDKAIEYINLVHQEDDTNRAKYEMILINREVLLNILKGDSDE